MVETTMTIDVKIQFSQDALLEKRIFLLDRKAFPEGLTLAAAEWEAERLASMDSLGAVLELVREKISEALGSYDLWLLLGHTAWQDDSRIVHHRKLFGSLKYQGVDFGEGAEIIESMVEQGGRIKFFGAVKLADTNVGAALKTMQVGSCTYLVAKDRSSNWPFPLSTGWLGRWNQDADLICDVVGNGGILLRRFGFFDDPEIGLQALGPPDILRKVASAG
ncbi:hypothetical protein CJO75_23465 (plasmid) [Ralstonia solanacearum]|nr:hypothetical protein CJO75_23465 [Ralstonia solanacearum]AXW17354.1 hypothetical protein CJO84_23665 [Ralstonia solanacearum]AXW41222.1 hypothetical protein CJO89_24050 [Ralstonia solanacearum]AXW74018.1 hypothetical protein CJO96_23355 [Ralstonia solanacearum]BEU70139.1 hypothetical protein MAFF301069_46940 [Ralstonia pseudosolanacearum]